MIAPFILGSLALLGLVFYDRFAGLVRPAFLFVLLLVCVGAMAGCSTAPEKAQGATDNQDAARAASCPPLPVCDIPGGATAKQLSEALWSCIQDYRAMYSACKHGSTPASKLAQGRKERE